MNRDNIGTQTCYIHQCTNKVMLMYIACLCPNLVSVHFYAIPILHFKFHKFYPLSSPHSSFPSSSLISLLLPSPPLCTTHSFHVGSNSNNPHVFLTALEMSQQLFLYAESLGYHFTLLDIGGGFPGEPAMSLQCSLALTPLPG